MEQGEMQLGMSLSSCYRLFTLGLKAQIKRFHKIDVHVCSRIFPGSRGRAASNNTRSVYVREILEMPGRFLGT
jgi:hypothetical protein